MCPHLGNRNIHELTDDGYTYLRIEMMDDDGVWKHAEYSTFYVDSGSSEYRLNVSGYSGNAGIFVQIKVKGNVYVNLNCFICYLCLTNVLLIRLLIKPVKKHFQNEN